MMLTYFSTVAKRLGRSDETHLAVVLTGHQDHTLGLDSTDLAWSQVGKDADLLAHHIFRRILLCNT